jgi:hypothetical protein
MENGEGDGPSPLLIPGPMGASALRSPRISHRKAPRAPKILRATARSRLVTLWFSNQRREIYCRLECTAQMQSAALTGRPTSRDSRQQLLATYPFVATNEHVWDKCPGATMHLVAELNSSVPRRSDAIASLVLKRARRGLKH